MQNYPVSADDGAYMEELARSGALLDESFEVLQRTLDNYSALSNLETLRASHSAESFEAVAKTVMSAVLAGSDMDPEDLDYSPESVGSWMKSAATAILSAIKTFFNNLIDFLSNLDVTSLWLTRKVGVIERRRTASRGKHISEPKIELGRMYRYLRAGKIYVEDSIRLERELNQLLEVINVACGTYLDEILKSAQRLTSAKGKYGKALDDELTNNILAVPWDALANRLHMKAAPAANPFGRGNLKVTPDLLGGISVYYLEGYLSKKGTAGLRYHGLVTDDSTVETFNISDTREFKTLGPADLGGIPGVLKEILTAISRGSQQSTRDKIKRTKSTLESFVRERSQDENLSESDMRAIRRTTSALTYWTHSVTRRLLTNSLSVCRITIAYCEKSIDTFR